MLLALGRSPAPLRKSGPALVSEDGTGADSLSDQAPLKVNLRSLPSPSTPTVTT